MHFDSTQLGIGGTSVALLLGAYVAYKIVKQTVIIALLGFLALIAVGGAGAYYVWR